MLIPSCFHISPFSRANIRICGGVAFSIPLTLSIFSHFTCQHANQPYIFTKKKKSTIYSILSTRVSFWTIEITKERPKRRVVSPYSSVWLAPINFININQRPPLQKAATTPDSRFVPIKILHLTSPHLYFIFLFFALSPFSLNFLGNQTPTKPSHFPRAKSP